MICKDCLHYEICEPNLYNASLKSEYAEICPKFKDKKQYVRLPFIAMIEQHLVEGKFVHNSLQNNNGKYAVVYLDENKWKIPLIDICGKTAYRSDEAETRLEELRNG